MPYIRFCERGFMNEKGERWKQIEYETANVEWVEALDENPSCKHKKVFWKEVNGWKEKDSEDLYRIVRHWICSKCLASGTDELINVPFDKKLSAKLWEKRWRTVLPFESLEGTYLTWHEEVETKENV